MQMKNTKKKKKESQMTVYNKFVITQYSNLSILKSNSKKRLCQFESKLVDPKDVSNVEHTP